MASKRLNSKASTKAGKPSGVYAWHSSPLLSLRPSLSSVRSLVKGGSLGPCGIVPLKQTPLQQISCGFRRLDASKRVETVYMPRQGLGGAGRGRGVGGRGHYLRMHWKGHLCMGRAFGLAALLFHSRLPTN